VRICVTNDDGVDAWGIHVLARRLGSDGHDVVVVAPADERSGAGTGLGRVVGGDSVRWTRSDADGCGVLAVDAPPAMCVLLALEGVFGAVPDVVVSGINHGPNLGFAVLHSGTVGAALTAHIAGVPALAVSLGEPATGAHGSELSTSDAAWERAAGVAAALVDAVGEWGREWVPNVNVPTSWDGVALDCCGLAPVGAIGLAVDGDDSALVRLRRHGDGTDEPATPDAWPDDLASNAAGRATLTPLRGVVADGFDPTSVEVLVDRLSGSGDLVRPPSPRVFSEAPAGTAIGNE